LSQDVSELDPTMRVLEAIESIRRQIDLSDGRVLTASALLERFGFTGQRQWTPVRDLSGGERRRLQLLRLLMEEPNVLLLDEPTNDLDVDTLTALEDLLDSWAGTLIAASHDRYFLERVCDQVTALTGGGALRTLVGGVDEYLALAAGRAAGSDNGAKPVTNAGAVREARKDLVRIERQLERLTSREKALHQQLASLADDYNRAAELDAELRTLIAERGTLEEDWLHAAERAGR
jgi:ABC transport system ATP-binding/permease protein